MLRLELLEGRDVPSTLPPAPPADPTALPPAPPAPPAVVAPDLLAVPVAPWVPGEPLPLPAPVQPPVWLGYDYTGLPDLVDGTDAPDGFDATAVAFNVVQGATGKTVDVRVDYTGPGASLTRTMLVSLYDVSATFVPVAVDCSTHAASGAGGSVWTNLGALQSNRQYVVLVTWPGQYGGQAWVHFYSA